MTIKEADGLFKIYPTTSSIVSMNDWSRQLLKCSFQMAPFFPLSICCIIRTLWMRRDAKRRDQKQGWKSLFAQHSPANGATHEYLRGTCVCLEMSTLVILLSLVYSMHSDRQWMLQHDLRWPWSIPCWILPFWIFFFFCFVIHRYAFKRVIYNSFFFLFSSKTLVHIMLWGRTYKYTLWNVLIGEELLLNNSGINLGVYHISDLWEPMYKCTRIHSMSTFPLHRSPVVHVLYMYVFGHHALYTSVILYLMSEFSSQHSVLITMFCFFDRSPSASNRETGENVLLLAFALNQSSFE